AGSCEPPAEAGVSGQKVGSPVDMVERSSRGTAEVLGDDEAHSGEGSSYGRGARTGTRPSRASRTRHLSEVPGDPAGRLAHPGALFRPRRLRGSPVGRPRAGYPRAGPPWLPAAHEDPA